MTARGRDSVRTCTRTCVRTCARNWRRRSGWPNPGV